MGERSSSSQAGWADQILNGPHGQNGASIRPLSPLPSAGSGQDAGEAAAQTRHTIVCAWCKRTVKHGDPVLPVTHGICESCSEGWARAARTPRLNRLYTDLFNGWKNGGREVIENGLLEMLAFVRAERLEIIAEDDAQIRLLFLSSLSQEGNA